MAQTESRADRKHSRHKRRTFGILSVLILIALAILAFVLTREHPLTERAARISHITNYCWISDQELLSFSPELSRAARINLQTHAADYLANFNAYIDQYSDKSANSTTGPVDHAVISPDRKRLLCRLRNDTSDYDRSETRTCISTLDDKRLKVYRNREQNSRGMPVWMPDGRRWLEFAYYHASQPFFGEGPPSGLWLYSLDAPERRVGPVPVPPAVRSLLGVTPDYRLIATNLEPIADQPMFSLFETGLFPSTLSDRQFAQNPPAGWFFRSAALAPQGDRIACLLTTARRSALLEFFARIAPSIFKTGRPSRLFQIRVCRTDGTHVQEVGFQDTGPDGTAALSNLQWTPDGKRLSFVLKDSLYVVPVE